MKTFILVLGALTVPAQTLGQTGQTATGGPVTWAELEKAVIEAEIVSDRVFRPDGQRQQFPSQARQSWKIVIGAEGIQSTYSATVRGPRRERKEGPRIGEAILDETRNTAVAGVGQALWHFEEEALIFTRSYKEGASRLRFVFSREGDGLSCQVSQTYARERGTGPIKMDSTFDGTPVTLVSYRQRSANCRVSKGM